MQAYRWGSAHGTQQLGGVAHGGGAVVEGRGELGGLVEVVLYVLQGPVHDACPTHTHSHTHTHTHTHQERTK